MKKSPTTFDCGGAFFIINQSSSDRKVTDEINLKELLSYELK